MEPKSYRVNVHKLAKTSRVNAIYLYGVLSVPENYEHFEEVKPFLDMPYVAPTTDERFDPLIARFKIEFSCLESRLDDKFKKFSRKQDEAFDFARRYGYFSKLHIATNATVSVKGLSNGELGWDPTSGQLLMASEKGTKWVSLGNSRWSCCSDKEPSAMVKWLAKVFLGLHWQPNPSI